MNKLSHALILALVLSLFEGCVQDRSINQDSEIIIHKPADAEGVNPVTARDELSNYLCMQIFQPLVDFDFQTEKVVGIIAEREPEIEIIDKHNLLVHFKIRPEAKFDDGSSITAKDVMFSLKAHLCPGVQSFSTKFFRFIDEVILYPDDPLKVSFKCNQNKVSTEFYCGAFSILPEKNYDPEGFLKDFTIEALKADSAKTNPLIQNFARQLNAQKFASDLNFIKGSGPYKIKQWEKGQFIRLEKKADWWGDMLRGENSYFNINAQKLKYQIINDAGTALIGLKANKIDLTASLTAKQFAQLQQEKDFAQSCNFLSITKSGFQYLGFNLKNDILKYREVREAIAHCIPKSKIIENVFYGLAQPTSVPLPANRIENFSKEITDYEFNPEKAKNLLLKSGWSDLDQDGILDKKVEEEVVSLKLDYAYNSGNEERKLVGLILKEKAKDAGIDISLSTYEWSVYLEKMKVGELEVFFGGVSTSLLPPDFRNSFHSEAASGGRNYFNYKNELADSLIDLLDYERNIDERKKAVGILLNEIHRDIPCHPLWTLEEGIVFSRSLKNVAASHQRPHYWAPSFKRKDR